VAEQASGFDVIHAQIDWVHVPLLQRFDVPFLTTLRGRLDMSGLIAVLRKFPGAALRFDLEPSAAVAAYSHTSTMTRRVRHPTMREG
jgi:hypothetical protein